MSGKNKIPRVRIMLVDDHEIVRRGLRDFVEREEGFEVCAEAANAAKALELCTSEKPDIALIDLSLGEDSGLELVKDISVRFPDTKMLVVSMQDEQLYAERVLRAGASGFLSKDTTHTQLIEALRCVLNGMLYTSPLVTQRIVQSIRCPENGSSLETLSDRELAVFEWIGKGEGTSSIAEVMSLSIKTIETYRARIKAKLNLKDSSELVQHAVQWGLERV